uniref:Uncharacterized protein n=1 Tax=Oryza sativa subsp. japonica TaxID=39947 RepID=Q6K3M4_ORYSJ|nr:hypothetical protein [Oryza sativa Japonica Group]
MGVGWEEWIPDDFAAPSCWQRRRLRRTDATRRATGRDAACREEYPPGAQPPAGACLRPDVNRRGRVERAGPTDGDGGGEGDVRRWRERRRRRGWAGRGRRTATEGSGEGDAGGGDGRQLRRRTRRRRRAIRTATKARRRGQGRNSATESTPAMRTDANIPYQNYP